MLHEYRSVLFVLVLSVDTECILSSCFEKMLWSVILVKIDTGGGFEKQFPLYSSDSAGSWATGDSVMRCIWLYWLKAGGPQSHERAVNNRAAIDTISSETQHTCGSCEVTTPSMWRVQNYELCVGILIQYIVLKDIRHVYQYKY